jgi:hypothetical protein
MPCYAKEVPFIEDARRVIVGIGRVRHVGDATEYKYSQPGKLRSILWERIAAGRRGQTNCPARLLNARQERAIGGVADSFVLKALRLIWLSGVDGRWDGCGGGEGGCRAEFGQTLSCGHRTKWIMGNAQERETGLRRRSLSVRRPSQSPKRMGLAPGPEVPPIPRDLSYVASWRSRKIRSTNASLPNASPSEK